MELRKLVGIMTATIVLGTLASSGALVVITSYLHRLAGQIEDNLQSVRAAEEIQLHLLWHARNTNQATLLASPEPAAAASESRAAVHHWYDEARSYVGTSQEQDVLDRLGQEIEAYFDDHETFEAAGLPALARYEEAVAPFQAAYDVAAELLQVNLDQAAVAAQQGRRWDAIATSIGISVAAILLVLMSSVIWGARATLYRPLLALRDGMRRYAAHEYGARVSENGAVEIREIARSFNEMAGALQRQRENQLAFVAAVAHDLRNPLAAMQAAVAVKEAQQAGNGRQTQMTRIIARQIDVLVRMISDLLDAARVEAGHYSIELAPCDARNLVTQTAELFSAASSAHEVRLRLPDSPLLLRCDAVRMSQVLNNVVGNAIKYSPNGGPVTIDLHSIDDRIVIDVSDEGPGIPSDEIDLIFEPFRRSPGVASAIPGVGIGLSVARRIVAAHGGSIEVRSTVGRGSTFTISLPSNACSPPRDATDDVVTAESVQQRGADVRGQGDEQSPASP